MADIPCRALLVCVIPVGRIAHELHRFHPALRVIFIARYLVYRRIISLGLRSGDAGVLD
jgi:hypothetical protein